MVSATSTIFNQIPRAKLLASKKRSERRIFLEKDLTINTWFFPLAPQFETKTRKVDNLPEVKCIYQLVFRENIQRIGETGNLHRRCKEYQRDNIPFDEVRYHSYMTLTAASSHVSICKETLSLRYKSIPWQSHL